MSLAELPTELLCLIIDYAQTHGSLRILSQSNWRIRIHCARYLFRALKITFSIAGFKRLHEVSKSYIAQHVRTIIYEAPEIIDPHVEVWDYFNSCIYTPSEYNKDQRDLHWVSRGRKVPYSAIYSYFAALSREQQTILTGRIDAIALILCIPRFLNLKGIELLFIDSTEKPFRWLAGRLFLDSRDTFPTYLETTIDAMIAARRNGMIVRKFKVSGFYSRISVTGQSRLLPKMTKALYNVEDLVLLDSSSLLNVLCQIKLPSLRQIELAKCCLSVTDLEQLSRENAETRHFLRLEEIWLPAQASHEQGISSYSSTL